MHVMMQVFGECAVLCVYGEQVVPASGQTLSCRSHPPHQSPTTALRVNSSATSLFRPP
jgi:hypothetical protein